MARTKTKAADLPVPQSREDAQAAIEKIGMLQRQRVRLEAELNDRIAPMKTAFEVNAGGIDAALTRLTEGLRIWADANRDALTDGRKVKTADLGTGLIRWRLRPASVTGVPKAAEKLTEMIARLRALKLDRFVRVEETIDKQAMLKEPEVARGVQGLRVASEGEDFVVEPFEAELAGGVS